MAKEHVRLLEAYNNARDDLAEDGPGPFIKAKAALGEALFAIPSDEDLARCQVALKSILGADEYTDDDTDDREHGQRLFIAEQAQIVMDILFPEGGHGKRAFDGL